jgi:hypothetical protein
MTTHAECSRGSGPEPDAYHLGMCLKYVCYQKSLSEDAAV